MTPQMVLDLTHRGIMTAAMVAAPMMITAIVVGIFINLFQTVTQMRDMSLTFVPKAVAAAVVIGFLSPWTLSVLIGFSKEMFALLGQM